MKKIIFGENKNIIHNNLKLLRIKNNFTQSQLAAKMQTFNINLDQQMISRIEQNSRLVTDYELVCFCLILDVNVKDMLEPVYTSLKDEYVNVT